jgi:hypothetical protein
VVVLCLTHRRPLNLERIAVADQPTVEMRDRLSSNLTSSPLRSHSVPFAEGAPFLPELETELLSFPQGKHDDQVDSITQALSHQASAYDGSLRWVTGE